ncbi:MAG: hypothetical protein R3C68_05420 [Myxococcota bacterium]
MDITPELKTRIENIVNKAPVVLFMKGTKNMPQCGFSATVVGFNSTMWVSTTQPSTF